MLIQKIYKSLLFFLIICIPLTCLPSKITIDTIGSPSWNYILLLALLFLTYESFKNKININKNLVCFFIVYILVQVISLIHGLCIYPYYNLISIEQIKKLYFICNVIDINIDKNTMLFGWLFIKGIKYIILESMFLILPAILFLRTFNDFKDLFKFIRKAVLFLVFLFGIYSIPEILYLKFNNQFAKQILEYINPLLYDICSLYGWYPPLLWQNQVRSLCTEPSYFGMISAFCVPFIWSYIYEKFSFKYIVVYVFFTILIFMTNSRTALALFIGENILLLLLSIYNFNKKILYFLIILAVSTILSLTINIVTYTSVTDYYDNNLNIYLKDNLISLTKAKSRSNEARFSSMIGTYKIATEHYLFGVGTQLKDAYMLEYFKKNPLPNNYEVENWVHCAETKGFLVSNFSSFNHFLEVYVINGIIGLLFFIFPIIYILYRFLKNKEFLKNIDICFIFIAFIGQIVSMFNTSYFISYPIILGMLLFVFIRKEKAIDL